MNQTEGPGGNGSGHRNGPRLGQRVGSIEQNAEQMWAEARAAVDDVNQMLDIKGRLERHPYATLLAAAGIGYVLGGGLFTSLTGSVLRVGLRLAAVPFVKDELLAMVQAGIEKMAEQAEHPTQTPGGAPV